MKRTYVKVALSVAAVGGVAALGFGPLMNAQAASTPSAAPSTPPAPNDQGHGMGGYRMGGYGMGGNRPGSTEQALASDLAAKVKAAVLAANPGATVDRTSTEDDGVAGAVYEAHATKADGTHVRLQLDKSYAIVKTEQGMGGGRMGGGRHGSDEADLPADIAAKVKAAALAAVPGGSVDRVSAENDGPAGAVYEAHATKADGTRVQILLDKAFAVLSTQDAPQHR